jgi:microcystin-dependent protein
MEEIEEGIAGLLNLQPYKVGDIYQTTIAHETPDAVAAHHGYGTWERFAEGRTLVGFSTNTDDPIEYKTMGEEFGENEHTLTELEMPSHVHKISLASQTNEGVFIESDSTNSGNKAETDSAGGDQPHNNIQPSKVVGKWLRTA